MTTLKAPRKSARFVEAPPAPAETTGAALSLPDPALPLTEPSRKIDGRSRNKTGRTIAFATRVSAEWKAKLDRIATERGLLYCEVLELALNSLALHSKRDS